MFNRLSTVLVVVVTALAAVTTAAPNKPELDTRQLSLLSCCSTANAGVRSCPVIG